MQLLPASIAGRTSAVLICGFVLTAALTFIASGWGETSRVLSHIAAVAAIVDRVPAAQRGSLLAAISEQEMAYSWPAPPPPALGRDWLSHHLAHDLRAALANPQLGQVEAGYGAPMADAATAPEPPRVDAWIRLTDGSWLRIALATRRVEALSTVRMAGALLVLSVGLVALAIWAARKVTAPLARFAAATQRLGTDINAPPMAEAGPSEIRAAAHAFNQMQGRIRRFVEERTLMLAAISHDLKTALTRLKLRTEFIPDEGQRRKAVADLEEMDGMLAATLSFARDEANAGPAAWVDLAVLLQSLCDDCTDAGKSARYDGPRHLPFRGHPLALRRLLGNVLDNAVKYGCEADVSLAVRGDAVEVVIGDRGPGVPPELRERVFAPFYRVEPSRNRDTGGTGLGLTVARTLIRHHGGDIALEDRTGGGLVVKITFPATGGR